MKSPLIILMILVLFVFSACNNKSVEHNTALVDTVDSGEAKMTENATASETGANIRSKNEPYILLKNKEDYSDNFIQGLKELEFKKFELADSLMIIDETDTVQFAMTPKVGEIRVYTGKMGNLAIALTIKRINYTSLEYKIEMVEFGKSSHNSSGQAEIISSFFLGAESNDDEQSGESYFVTEYIDKENDCYTHIRLGDETDLVKIIKNCNGKIKDITLDNFTTLHRK